MDEFRGYFSDGHTAEMSPATVRLGTATLSVRVEAVPGALEIEAVLGLHRGVEGMPGDEHRVLGHDPARALPHDLHLVSAVDRPVKGLAELDVPPRELVDAEGVVRRRRRRMLLHREVRALQELLDLGTYPAGLGRLRQCRLPLLIGQFGGLRHSSS